MKPYAGTQAVQRALRLLKAVGRQDAAGLAALAESLRLNKTTAYRLLTALEAEGLVERTPAGDAYRLGPELLALGSRALGASDLRMLARPLLEQLAQRTHETATLELLLGDETLILDEVMGGHRVGTLPSVGTRWPAHATSTGKALLADLEADALAEVLRLPLAAPTARTLRDPAQLRRELERVRDRGYAVSAEELEPGFVAVGAPVRAAGGRAVAALSLGGPRGRISAERIAEFARLLRPAAAHISERLGFRPADSIHHKKTRVTA